MSNVKLGKNAEVKYKLLTNGIRKSIESFFNSLSSGKTTIKDLMVLQLDNGKDDSIFYYYKCESIYVVLAPLKEDWGILDFLTEEEIKPLITSV
ncbi:MAG: hypothetical protein V1850_00675 [Candidatus Bathyarchaeota archaeon]